MSRQTSCNKAPGGIVMLGGTMIEGDGMHVDHSDEDEIKLRVGPLGEYPPRVRWLWGKDLTTLVVAMFPVAANRTGAQDQPTQAQLRSEKWCALALSCIVYPPAEMG